jgi:ethanolamine phosphate transferase 2 subunit G
MTFVRLMARDKSIRTGLIALANILLPAAVAIFAIGFFPYKPLLSGLATFEKDEQELQFFGDSGPAPVFDRVIFMVVDALRTDFVYGYNSGFHFTQRFVQNTSQAKRRIR